MESWMCVLSLFCPSHIPEPSHVEEGIYTYAVRGWNVDWASFASAQLRSFPSAVGKTRSPASPSCSNVAMLACRAQGTDESQASGAASFLSSTPSRLTHSDMGPPAHKTVSLQELATGKAAPRVRFPVRAASRNGAPEKGDSPAHEQAASCNDAGSQIESECVTPHNQLKVRASRNLCSLHLKQPHA